MTKREILLLILAVIIFSLITIFTGYNAGVQKGRELQRVETDKRYRTIQDPTTDIEVLTHDYIINGVWKEI